MASHLQIVGWSWPVLGRPCLAFAMPWLAPTVSCTTAALGPSAVGSRTGHEPTPSAPVV